MVKDSDEDALFTEALALKDSGDFSASLKILNSLAERRDDSVALLAVLGDVYWELEQHNDAVVQFQKAVNLAPLAIAASLGLFHCLWDQNRREEALEEAKRFTKKTGSDEYMEIVREINGKDPTEPEV